MTEEKIIFDGKVPWRVFLFSCNFFFILLFGWNLGLIWAIFKSLGFRVKISSQRLVVVQGILAQKEEQIEFYRVKDTSYEQGVLQRLGGVGLITVISDDETCPKINFPIHNPYFFCEEIRNCVREERQKMKSIQMD